MGDPLSLLRQFNINKKEIIVKDDIVIFGEFSWKKNVKTNYHVYGSSKDGATKEYYTLECLLLLLKNVDLRHPDYVRMAANENIPVVRRPDRKELLAYLNGDTATAAAIDKSAPLEIPTQVKRTIEQSSDVAAKKQRFDENESLRMRQQFQMKMAAPKVTSITSNIDRSLSDAMSYEKIASIKAKRATRRRELIKGADDLPNDAGYGIDVTKDITGKERVWRNRTSVLQSTGKQFDGIIGQLKSIRLREEGRQRQQTGVPGGLGGLAAGIGGQHHPKTPQAPGYSRYAQEKFNPKEETAGFKIDTMSTYHGMDLKSVTEGGRKVGTPAGLKSPGPNTIVPSTPRNISSVPTTPTGASPGGASPVATPPGGQGARKISRKPIIIVPNSHTNSLITMLNAKDLLQDMKFISHDDKRKQGTRREQEILIQRGKEGGLTVPYRVTDNPGKLTHQEWDSVVAVFAMGPQWQFKGWPYDGNPIEIFNRICAFHIKFDNMKLDPNIGKWSVHVISLSRRRPHLDRAAFQQCWEKLDSFMLFHKPHLRS